MIQGEWKVYAQGSDPKEFARGLDGFHTQWCIAGEGSARSYLTSSGLYIYFSEDEKGESKIPRACIVASRDGSVTEVRGGIEPK